jgi:hypothetical protein
MSSVSFNKFDVGHVQHQSFRARAFRAQEAFELQTAAEGAAREQPGVRLESHRGELGAHLAPAARLVLLGLVRDLEVDRGEPGRRVAQRPELKQPAAQL